MNMKKGKNRINRISRQWRKRALSAVAVVVLFATTYSLILPAITLDNEVAEEAPGIVLEQTVEAAEYAEPTDIAYDGISAPSEEYELLEPAASEEISEAADENPEENPEENPVTTKAEPLEESEDSAAIADPMTSEMPEEGASEKDAPEEEAPEEEAPEESKEPKEEEIQGDPTADVEYASTWNAMFQNMTLTGVYGEDLLTVARSQLGYTESTKNYIVQDGKTYGYTRYGAWYGSAYADWCAMFVSFCLNYAGISKTEIPYAASCPRWVNQLYSLQMFAYARDGYVPKPGDLIFFEQNGDNSADHVGIVESVSGSTITTIEGNTSNNQVRRNTYSTSDNRLYGYGVLPVNRPAQSFRAETESVQVSVTAEKGALPAKTTMEVEEITDADVLKAITEAVDGEITSVQAVDITFKDYYGNEVEPAKPVQVTMTSKDIEGSESQVVHVDDEGKASVVEQKETADDATVVFDADAFSVYAVVGMETITVPFVASDGRTYEVTVTYSKDAGIPEDTEFHVSEVTKNNSKFNEYIDQAAEAIGSDVESINYIKLLDISITKNGEKVQLDAPVDVQIRLMDREEDQKTTQVVHFAGEEETPEVIIPSVEGDTVSFETDGFSIYVIVDDGEGNETPPRRRYHFVHLNGNGAIVPYYFYNSAGELLDNQIIKTGDVLEPINTPYIPDEKIWIEWRVVQLTGYNPDITDTKNYDTLSYGREVVFGAPLTVTEKEDVYLIPFYGDYHTITFIDYLFNGDEVSGYLIYNKEEVPLGTTYDTTVQTVPSHKSVGDGDDADLLFAGWRLLHASSKMTGYYEWNNGVLELKPGVKWSDVDATDMPDGHVVPGVERDDDKFVVSIKMDPDESRNYVLLPVYQKAYWVEYYSAPTGSGATYVAPKHVRVGQTAAAAGAEPSVDMTWKGYEFQYWTTEETFDENGKLIEFASGREPARYDFDQLLSSDVKLNAYWKKANTTYTVMYWRQQLADDKSLEGDAKHYDYAGQRTGTATVDSTVTLTTADQNMNDSRYNGTDDDYKKYIGFSYAKSDEAGKTVNADGSTVINVYYDRDLITMNFDRDIESYTKTDSTTGPLYGVVDGEYVEITRNGENWVYTTAEQHTEYADYTGTRYNIENGTGGTQYTDTGIRVYYHRRGGPFQPHWSTNSTHARGDEYNAYTGTRYVENANGAYGLVDGSMIQLVNGQAPTTTTQYVEHIYEGDRYERTTTRSFTGLYGQLLEKYGYKWPSEYVWQYEDSDSGWYTTHYTGMTYLGQFVLPNNVRDTTGKVINLTTAGNVTNRFEFYLQKPDADDVNDVDSYRLGATGTGSNMGLFTLSEKYEGYAVYGYRRYIGTGANRTYVDGETIRLGSVNDQVTVIQSGGFGGSTYYNLEVYYKVYSYNVTYKDPVTREALSNKAFNYGLDIDNTGAPAKAVVEGHVPTGYRLKTDEHGNIIWYADPNMEVEFDFDRAMPNHDLEVFPGFEPIYCWIKIEPNGGQLSDTESTWFWKRHGDPSVYEYKDAVREYAEDENGAYYYHYDEFSDPDNDVNQYGTQVRKAEYRLKSAYTGEGTWEDDSYDGKSYSPSSGYALDGWYEVTKDASGKEVLIPYHFGSPITHNTTLRAVWIKTGVYSTVYRTEGVDADGNPLFTYTVGNDTYLVTHNSDDTYTYKDKDGETQTLASEDVSSLVRLTGSDAPVGGRTYEDEANTIILHRPDPPAGYVCTGYYFNGTVYIPGNVFKIDSRYDGADGDIDQQFTFYPIYEPLSDRNVQVTNVYFDPNVDQEDKDKVTMDPTLADYYEDNEGNRYDSEGEGRVQKQSVNSSAKTVAFLNRQVNKEIKLLGEIYSREGYTLKGWSLTPGENNHVDFQLGQEKVAADNLSKEGNPNSNTLYAVWEVKTYTVTVEKIVVAGWEWDKTRRFIFVPDFTGMAGITTELQTNFALTGDTEANTHIKTFATKIPYGTAFSITESEDGLWQLEAEVTVKKDDGTEHKESYTNGSRIELQGDTTITFTNTLTANAEVVLIKMNEKGTNDDASSENLASDKILSGAVFTLLRKATEDGHYENYLTGITIGDAGYTVMHLPQGYYQLVETTSPDGYVIQNGTWEFVVGYYGNVYAENQADLMLNRSSESSSSEVDNRTLLIINHPGSALPMTGGSGALPYTLGGLMLIIVSALMYGFRMRRRERRLN